MVTLAKIKIQSKKHLANQISSKKMSYEKARLLIDFVINNFDTLWKDNIKESEPEKNKWVRTAYGTDLGKLLKLIDLRVLAPQDKNLPNFIFGGRKGMSNVNAAKSLLGYNKERTLLALDIKSFFENVDISKVKLFYKNSGCSVKAAGMLSKLSCVKRGPKNNPENQISITRGFSTSSRLAIWSNIISFYKIHDLVIKRLKGHDPRIAFFIDDIGISASRVPESLLRSLEDDIDNILKKDSNGKIILNRDKTDVMNFKDGIEHLGIVLNREKLVLPNDLKSKMDWNKYQFKMTGKSSFKDRYKGYKAYEGSLIKANRK